jgi:nitrate/TMAO reductase-like tetraheme cytochrome c subunit
MISIIHEGNEAKEESSGSDCREPHNEDLEHSFHFILSAAKQLQQHQENNEQNEDKHGVVSHSNISLRDQLVSLTH